MKRIWNHPAESANASRSWRGPASHAGSDEARKWVEREFQEGAADGGGLNRREFTRLMGAATALAGLGGVSCRKPESHLVPFIDGKGAEWTIPGKATLYTSAMPWEGGAVPLVVTTFEGRPTKLEGNPLHPGSRGGTSAITQASILDLYDPDRSRFPLARGQKVGKADMEAELDKFAAEFTQTNGDGVGFLLGNHSSPTRRRLIKQLRQMAPKARWFRYEVVEDAGIKGDRAVLGEGRAMVPDFRKAMRVLALEADFLGAECGTADARGDFSEARKPEDKEGHPREDFVRLYVAESAMSLTGGMADHRIRVKPSELTALAAAVAAAVAESTGDAALAGLARPLAGEVKSTGLDPRWIEACAADLVEKKGKSLVVAGPRQSAVVRALAMGMNKALGSLGEGGCAEVFVREEEEFESLVGLADAVSQGEVDKLVSLTPADPAYDTAGDFDWEKLAARLKRFIHLGSRVNRTAMQAHLHVPGTHFLEEWGDVLDARGVYSIIQPMILPLYGGVSELAFLVRLIEGAQTRGAAEGTPGAGAPVDPVHKAVRITFEEQLQAVGRNIDAQQAWDATLRDGYLEGSGFAAEQPAAEMAGGVNVSDSPAPAAEGEMEIRFVLDAKIYDGRFINNGWLQEAPDPVTKLTWDNAALMSPTTAEALGIYSPKGRKTIPGVKIDGGDRYQQIGDGDQNAPMIRISVGGSSVEVPALVAFGHVDGVITLPLGYGQDSAEAPLPMRVGRGTGFDVNPLRRMKQPWVVTGKVEVTGNTYTLALTQEHGAMEGRALVREGTLEHFQDNPEFADTQGADSHIPPNISLYKTQGWDRETRRFDTPHLSDERNQWGMVIDLTQCTGCNACLTACQAENNIPIVGKEQVRRGREMHWIRMDRYFVAKQDSHGHFRNEDNPEMLVQPVACVQCQSAPCETVCPVNATIHSEDGLNVMAYNRCIGTRYCANNCPYKARRFNYFDYNKRPLDELYKGPFSSRAGVPEPQKLGKNPNVSVRMRGVMEKCTYCIQRLEAAKINRFERRRRKPQETGKPSHEVEVSVDEIRVPGDAVKVACQQACPSEAIIFGNLLDPQGTIHRYKEIDMTKTSRPIRAKHPRSYDLLKYLNTLPRTSYLARIRNPNPRMPDGAFVGNATVSIH